MFSGIRLDVMKQKNINPHKYLHSHTPHTPKSTQPYTHTHTPEFHRCIGICDISIPA